MQNWEQIAAPAMPTPYPSSPAVPGTSTCAGHTSYQLWQSHRDASEPQSPANLQLPPPFHLACASKSPGEHQSAGTGPSQSTSHRSLSAWQGTKTTFLPGRAQPVDKVFRCPTLGFSIRTEGNSQRKRQNRPTVKGSWLWHSGCSLNPNSSVPIV